MSAVRARVLIRPKAGILDPQGIAVEACCGAAEFGEQLGRRTGWRVHLAHPGYVQRLKQGPDKSDHHDAWLLADLVRIVEARAGGA